MNLNQDNKTEVFAERSFVCGSIKLWVRQTLEAGRKAYGRSIMLDVVEPHEEYGIMRDPTLELRLEEAQQLMDELWRVGLRPTEGTGSAGSLAATERHLRDMQSIAFRLLDQVG